MQQVKDIIAEFRSTLSSVYEKGELEQIIFLAFEHICGFSKTDLVLRREEELPKDKCDELNKIPERLRQHEPIQYILGVTEFYGLKLKVNRHVLIPRQETEELTGLIIREAHPLTPSRREGGKRPSFNILDICTGSGCIAIALKKNIPKADVFALDNSADALKVAVENAALNNTPIHLLYDDINKPFDKLTASLHPLPFTFHRSFDLIVSNPPYVMKSQMKEMTDRELRYEPPFALFVEDVNPLLFYRRIAELATQLLKPCGRLYFEINELMGKEVCELLSSKGFKSVTLRQDLNGKDRMVSCHWD